MPSFQPKHIAIAIAGLGILVVAALVMRCGSPSRDAASVPPPEEPQPEAVSITRDDVLRATEVEAPDSDHPGSFSEYPPGTAESPPPAEGPAAYPSLRNRVVRIAIDSRPSWASLLLRNHGDAPGATWTTPDGETFQVELVRIADPVALRDAFAAGRVHAACASVGTLADWAPALCRDSRSAPRVFQQLDWSAGADRIVIRRRYAADPARPTPRDLRGEEGKIKKIVVTEDSPGREFALRVLIGTGIQPDEVEFIPARDPLQAAAMFRTDPSLAACAGVTTEIHALGEAEANCTFATTAQSRHLLAGIWFARADFARDHPDLCDGLVQGITEANAALKTPDGRREAAEWMAAADGISADSCLALLDGSRPTRPAENRDFFLDRNNPANFQRTWQNACCIHQSLGEIETPLPFTAVLDLAAIRRLFGNEPAKASEPERAALIAARPAIPKSIRTRRSGDATILAESLAIRFAPNSWDPLAPGPPRSGASAPSAHPSSAPRPPYDPDATATLREAARIIALRGADAAVIIEGHADSSNRAKIDLQFARDLSLNRARAVKAALLQLTPDLAPSHIKTFGAGWSRPANPAAPSHRLDDRRAEITILTDPAA